MKQGPNPKKFSPISGLTEVNRSSPVVASPFKANTPASVRSRSVSPQNGENSPKGSRPSTPQNSHKKLIRILASKEVRTKFEQFLKAEHSVENLYFYEQVEKFKMIENPNELKKEVCQLFFCFPIFFCWHDNPKNFFFNSFKSYLRNTFWILLRCKSIFSIRRRKKSKNSIKRQTFFRPFLKSHNWKSRNFLKEIQSSDLS